MSNKLDFNLDLTSNDAMHWASQLERQLKAGVSPDADYLVGWFANYWAAVHDPLKRRIEELEATLSQQDAQPSTTQDVEEWIEKYGFETSSKSGKLINAEDLRAFLAGKALVDVGPIEVLRANLRDPEAGVIRLGVRDNDKVRAAIDALLTASKGE